jgi:hypothetical protein
MVHGFVAKVRRVVARTPIVVAAGLAMASAPASAQASDPWPQQVDAVYRIAINGFDIGRFTFRAEFEGNTYKAQSNANISALLGAFWWKGASRSSGSIAALAPRPRGYTFDYDGTGKSGAVKLGFQQGTVTSISVTPQLPAEPGTVPLLESHLPGALDPLSTVIALSRTTQDNPCNRRLAVFDGKQRFDLVLAFVRQERVAETRPSGQPGVASVCRVRYVPVGGYHPEATRAMAQAQAIEISLRPVPSAGLFVPYQISIPTAAGTATLVSEKVQIVTRREQIALSH